MKKYIAYILPVFLLIGFTFLISEKIFSQSDQKENKTDTASVTTMPDKTSSYVSGITTGRARSLVGVALGLISVVIGWRVKARSAAGTINTKAATTTALVLGLIAIVLSILHLIASAGAVFGSGSGKAGAIVGLALGLIGVTLTRLALRKKKI